MSKKGHEQTNIVLFQCFFTAKMVARKSDNVTSYVYCLACYEALNQWK